MSKHMKKAKRHGRARRARFSGTPAEPGYVIGLHPSSQTPIAIEFRMGEGQKSSDAPLILKPGQIGRTL
jgi:hypothetical protein